tara:strand:- start:787 stop:1134 length:348 start_codon:yes stop_codon:yes gene_type:complete
MEERLRHANTRIDELTREVTRLEGLRKQEGKPSPKGDLDTRGKVTAAKTGVATSQVAAFSDDINASIGVGLNEITSGPLHAIVNWELIIWLYQSFVGFVVGAVVMGLYKKYKDYS